MTEKNIESLAFIQNTQLTNVLNWLAGVLTK